MDVAIFKFVMDGVWGTRKVYMQGRLSLKIEKCSNENNPMGIEIGIIYKIFSFQDGSVILDKYNKNIWY